MFTLGTAPANQAQGPDQASPNSRSTPLKRKPHFPNITAKCFSSWLIVDKKLNLGEKQTEVTEGCRAHFV